MAERVVPHCRHPEHHPLCPWCQKELRERENGGPAFHIPTNQRMIPAIPVTALSPEERKKYEINVERFSKVCIYMGEVLGPPSCCGTSELRACSVHGKCRHHGVPSAGEKICTPFCNEWITKEQ